MPDKAYTYDADDFEYVRRFPSGWGLLPIGLLLSLPLVLFKLYSVLFLEEVAWFEIALYVTLSVGVFGYLSSILFDPAVAAGAQGIYSRNGGLLLWSEIVSATYNNGMRTLEFGFRNDSGKPKHQTMVLQVPSNRELRKELLALVKQYMPSHVEWQNVLRNVE